MEKKRLIMKTVSMMLGVLLLFTNIYAVGAETEGQKGVLCAAEATETETTPVSEVSEASTPEISAMPTPEVSETPEISATPAPEVSVIPTPETSVTPTPEVSEAPVPEISATPTPEISVTPTPEVSATPTPEVSEVPVPSVTPTPTPVQTGAPEILSLTGNGEGNSLDKMSPAFSPEIHVYHFLDSGQVGRIRTMTAVVEKDVTVTVNGQETPVRKDGTCTLKITYQGEKSENDVVLTRNSTGETSVYQFHTYTHSVHNYSGEYQLVDSKGQNDENNIGALEKKDGSPVYDAYVNLEKVRLKMKASPPSGEIFQADLVDSGETKIDSFFAAGEEEAGSVELQSKVLKLAEGENIFYLRCYGTYDSWENGKHEVKQGVSTVMFRIYRNSREEQDANDTTLKNIGLYLNGTEGKNYLDTFDPDKRVYKIKMPVEEFDEAIEKNFLWLNTEAHNDGQNILVYGGSTMEGIAAADLKKQENGCYCVGRYNSSELYSSDNFKINIEVTAKNKIDKAYYRIMVEKTGKSGMVIPDVYRNTSFDIIPSQPERNVQLVLGSTNIYDNGEVITGFNAIYSGRLTIEIKDPSIIAQQGHGSSGSFTVRLKKAGRTPVKVVYDDGNLHFEDEVTVSVYYSISSLIDEIHRASDLLDTAEDGSHIYPDEAVEAFSKELRNARLVYSNYVSTKVTEEQRKEISDAYVSLEAAEDVFRRSECGKRIEAFVPLGDEILNQEVETDASILEIKRPKTLTAVIEGKEEMISGIKWISKPSWQVKEYEKIIYRFTPVLPGGYVLADGVDLPVITVTRAARGMDIIVKRTIPLDESILVQHVPYGTLKSELQLPTFLEMYKNAWMGSESEKMEIPVRWRDLDKYDGCVPGTYRFYSVIDPFSSGFKQQENTTMDPMQTITIIVDEKKKDDDPKDNDHGKDDKPGNNKPGNGDGKGNGNGNGNGSGNGNGNGKGNGSGSGGKDNGHGKGNKGSGTEKGDKTKKGNGTGTGNNGTAENGGTGGTGNESVPMETHTAGENSGNDENTEENTGIRSESGGSMQGDDSQDSSEPENTGIKKDTEEKKNLKTNREEKKHWKVRELAEEKISEHKNELWILGIVILLLLIWGGFREYRKYKKEKR